METIGSKRSYALIWCMPNNDDDDDLIAFHLVYADFVVLMKNVTINNSGVKTTRY